MVKYTECQGKFVLTATGNGLYKWKWKRLRIKLWFGVEMVTGTNKINMEAGRTIYMIGGGGVVKSEDKGEERSRKINRAPAKGLVAH